MVQSCEGVVEVREHPGDVARFVLAAIITPVLSWVVGSAADNTPLWFSFTVELAAMLAVVFMASFIARSATGWAVTTGLGLTFGLAALVTLYFGIRGVNACGGRGFSTAACPDAPVTAAIGILVQVGCAIALAFWLAARSRKTVSTFTAQPLPGRPDQLGNV